MKTLNVKVRKISEAVEDRPSKDVLMQLLKSISSCTCDGVECLSLNILIPHPYNKHDSMFSTFGTIPINDISPADLEKIRVMHPSLETEQLCDILSQYDIDINHGSMAVYVETT